MERVEEFNLSEKKFICIDFSGCKNKNDFFGQIKFVEPIISKYPENSLHAIVNIEDVRFDSDLKDILVKFLEHNKPYINASVIIGIDGVKKMSTNIIAKLSGRNNLSFAYTREQAIEHILKRE